MIKAIISDFSRTLLFPKDKAYEGSLNELYRNVKDNEGFKFFDYFEWNQPLNEFYEKLMIEKQIRIYIFTTDKIQEDPEVLPYTQYIYSDVLTIKDVNGLKKDDPETYRMLAQRIELEPNQILFIDDSEANIRAASQTGIQTIRYRNMGHLRDDSINLFI